MLSKILAWIRGEPVMAVSGALSAVIEVLVAYHVGPNSNQKAAILGAVPLILGLIVRSQVTPVANAAAKAQDAATAAAAAAVATLPELVTFEPDPTFVKRVADELVQQGYAVLPPPPPTAPPTAAKSRRSHRGE